VVVFQWKFAMPFKWTLLVHKCRQRKNGKTRFFENSTWYQRCIRKNDDSVEWGSGKKL